MDAKAVIDSLSIGENARIVREQWGEVESTLDESGKALFSADTVVRLAKDAGVSPTAISALEAHVAARRSDEAWSRFLWLSHLLLYRKGAPVRALPRPAAREKDLMMDRLLLAVSGIPYLRARHRASAVPSEITGATIRDLSRWTDYFEKELGSAGITERILGWYQCHIGGKLFEIGRLQFMPATFEGAFHVFRSKKSRETMVFCDDGLRFEPNGLLPADGDPSSAALEARFHLDDHVISGFEVTVDGYIQTAVKTLVASEWENVLEPGTPVVEIHIPAGSSLPMADCADSVGRAADLLPRWFPDHHFVAFVCEAWLLDPRFTDILGVESNIVRFARHFHRYPAEGEMSEALARVFGERARTRGTADAPRSSRLQKAFARYVEEGGTVTAAGGFFLRDDLPFREGVYSPRGR